MPDFDVGHDNMCFLRHSHYMKHFNSTLHQFYNPYICVFILWSALATNISNIDILRIIDKYRHFYVSLKLKNNLKKNKVCFLFLFCRNKVYFLLCENLNLHKTKFGSL